MESVVYKVWCGRCEGEKKTSVYVGESGRSAWERGGDHLRAWRAKEEGSFLWKHSVNEHGGELREEDVKMRVVSTPRKALQRQVEEEQEGNIMNSKKGYGTNKINENKSDDGG